MRGINSKRENPSSTAHFSAVKSVIGLENPSPLPRKGTSTVNISNFNSLAEFDGKMKEKRRSSRTK